MSARSHVDVNERRLRPIYDCLDNGNNKKALQEADKVLKKQKDLLCAKVLKALALLRLGRHDESQQLLEEVHAQSPTDESTLLAMGIAYRELHKLDLIADMYENAHRERPDNEEVLSALFMAYVRLSDYKKQQQTAMKLHRLRPAKNPYYFWAVMSIVMQAHMDKKLAKNMYLPLAERMASKYVAENKIEAEAEVQMYLIVLEELDKFEEALQVVVGPLGEKLTSDPRFQRAKEAELLIKLERWAEANKAYKKLLIENNDDWSHYKAYFKTAFALIASKWTPGEENGTTSEVVADYTLDQVVSFLDSQLETAGSMHYVPRGPYLAQLLLHQTLKEHNMAAPDNVGAADILMRQYLTRFGDRPCCFSDLRLFLHLIPADQAQKMIDDLCAELNLETESKDLVFAQDPKTLQRHMSLVQLAHCSGLHDKMSHEEKLAFSQILIRRYKEGLSLGEGLCPTDLQYSDNYIMLASHIMVEVYHSNGDKRLLWQTIVQLEKALISSPSNFQIKLLLIRLYSYLGCVGSCLKLYESMEIKYVQTDSLGYTVVNHLCRLGHFNAAASIYGAMLRFFTVNHKDTTEYLTASYKFGSFTKIHEFVLFRERLQNSLQFANATAERLMLDLTQETTSHQVTERMLSYMEIDPVNDKTVWDDLRDNRDLSVMLTWDPASRTLSEAQTQQSYQEEVAWLKVRNLTLRCLAAAVLLTQHAVPNNNSLGNGDAATTNMADVLQGLMSELRTHLKECEKSPPTLEYPVCGPSPTRLRSYLKGSYAYVLLDALDTLFYVHTMREGGLEKADKAKEEKMGTLCKDLKGYVTEACSGLLKSDKDVTSFDPNGLEAIVHTAELLSHITIVVGACHRMLKPLKAPIAKRNKKKKDSNPPPLPPTFTHFNGFVHGLVEVARQADSGLAAVDMELLSSHLSTMSVEPQDTEEDSKLAGELLGKVRESYELSVKEVRHLISTKTAYLSSLNL